MEQALAGDPAVIVVRGAAGSGKSVLAQQAAERFAARGGTAVWVRFAPDDFGPEMVWHRIFSTIWDAGLAPEGSRVAALAAGGLMSSTPHIMSQAFAELPQPLLLVLDDLRSGTEKHKDPALDASLLDGLETSAGLTMLITSRGSFEGLTSPAARTRVPVREIIGAELALSLEDTERVVEMRLTSMPPGERPAFAKAIHAQTHGWPLVAHSIIVEHTEVGHVGSATKLSNPVRDITDQVLEASKPEVREMLCASAILDEISVDAFAQMLEVPSDEAERLLTSSFEASFGYWEDESGTRWYRHHDLIRDELRIRAATIIGPERLKAMGARAATAIGQRRSALAVQAALIGESWEFLSDHLVNLTDFALKRARPATWLSDIPESVRRDYPVLAAFALLDEYAFPAGRVGQVLAGFRLLADRTLAAESMREGMPGLIAATLRMIAGRLSGRDKLATNMVERVVAAIGEATGEQPEAENRARDTATTQAAVTLMHAGRFLEADGVLEPLHIWKARALPRSTAHATALSAWSSAMQGEMREAKRFEREALALNLPLGWRDSYIGTGYRVAAAFAALELGDPDQAERHLAALAEHEATIEHWPFLATVQAYIVETRNGPGEALQRLERELARRRGRFAPLAATTDMLKTHRARLQWKSGQALSHGLRRKSLDQRAIYVALSRNENAKAARLAAALLADRAYTRHARSRAELLLLEAEALTRSGNVEAARGSARPAADIMAEYGFTLPMRVLSRATAEELAVEIPQLTAAHAGPDAVREVTPLTAAERRALLAVVEHGSIAAAAAALFLSPETVKGHIKLVYRKLGVNNRDEAIRVATQARLLDPAL